MQLDNKEKYRLLTMIKTTMSAKMLYCFMIDVSNGADSLVVSTKAFAKCLGLSKSCVRKNLHRLEDVGLVSISTRTAEDGGCLANKYTIYREVSK